MPGPMPYVNAQDSELSALHGRCMIAKCFRLATSKSAKEVIQSNPR